MREFNADRRASEREQSHVTIGGTVFHPVRLTNATVKKVRVAALAAQEAVKEKGGEDTEAGQEMAFKSLADQLVILLADGAGKSPTKQHLAEHLDQRDAIELLGWLMEADDGGNSSAAPTETTAAITS